MLKWMLIGLLAMTTPVRAQEQVKTKEQAQHVVDALQFRVGQVAVPKAQAHFKLGEQFRYLEAADARKVLEQLWGNPADDTVLGMVVPRAHGVLDAQGWAVVVTYSDDGYVSDSDAAKIDYADLLKEMQSATRDENAQRKKAGYEAIHIVGWAAPPRYDAVNKKLYWAKELSFEGNDAHTLNYDIRVLGRRGYLSLNAVAPMNGLGEVQAGMQQLLPQVEFDSGARYADYDASNDKLAAYGIAALVGGGLAAKAGLFGKLGLMLLGLKKLLIPLGLVVVAFFKKIRGLFGRNKQGGTVQ